MTNPSSTAGNGNTVKRPSISFEDMLRQIATPQKALPDPTGKFDETEAIPMPEGGDEIFED